MRPRILIVAFHMPPLQGGSGIHRMLSFSRYLPDLGWDVKILTVSPNAYGTIHLSNFDTIPSNVQIIRAPTLDTRRHLAIGGRYLRLLALPDNLQSWIITGIWHGVKLIRKWRPMVILSTFPIASAHAIALGLNRLFNIPWIADFRDPMAQPDYPIDPWVRRSYWIIEKSVMKHARHITVTTKGTLDLYRDRYGAAIGKRITVIENGFDENLFPQKPDSTNLTETPKYPLQILHSGLVYSWERDPSQLFYALSELKEEKRIDCDKFRFFFRASHYSDEFSRKFSHLNLSGIVEFDDTPLPYKKAIEEMVSADALLVLQGAVCNVQIPAKVYEYLAARKPILALTDLKGNTADLLIKIGVQSVFQIDSKEKIKRQLLGFLNKLQNNQITLPDENAVNLLSRRARTKELVEVIKCIHS